MSIGTCAPSSAAWVSAECRSCRSVDPPEATVLAALVGFGPAPHGAAWSAGAEALANAGLASVTTEGELVVDSAVRLSLVPEYSPSAREEAEERLHPHARQHWQ